MSLAELFPGAAEEVVSVVKGASGVDLSSPTPCTEFDLRALINHFVGTTAALTRVGLRTPMDADDPYGSRLDPSRGDWSGELANNLEELAQAWSPQHAWEGNVDVSGNEMPATMIGEMAVAEMLLHGWDLARATGQQLAVSDEVADELRRSIDETGELGRTMGAYGAEISLGDHATAFERALAGSGRDPAWTAD